MRVPEEWKNEKLENVAFLQRGFDLPTNNRVKGRVPIISSGGITGHHNLAQCQAPGVVTGRYGSIGDVFFVEEDYWPLNTSLWVKNFCGNNPKYIYYLLSKIDFAKFSDKTGVPGINRNDLHAIKVPVPPLIEQQKISQILSTWDKAIEKLEALIAAKQKRKKALMQQLLTGKKRFAGFEGEWKYGRLGDLAFIDSGFAFKSSDFTNEFDSFPVIRMSDIKSGSIDLSEPAKVPKYVVNGLDRYALRYGDFIFGMSGSLTNFAWVKHNDLPCYLNQRVGRISAKSTAHQLFVTYLFLSEKTQKEILDKAAGASQLNISIHDLRGIEVKFPRLEEQQKIASVLSSADTEIQTHQKHLSALKEQKKGLMQQLLTGKKRVKVEAHV